MGDDEGASNEEIVMDACKRGYKDMLNEVLAEKGKLDINKTDGIGNTALHYCAKNGRTEMAGIILKIPNIKLNKKNFEGDTPLHLATRADHVELVRLLLESGANPNIMNKNKQTPKTLTKTKAIVDVISSAVLASQMSDADFASDDENE